MFTTRQDLPLEGVRVLTLTTGIAGPNAARYLANFGAEVIKVESREGGLDAFRFFGSDLDASPRFLETNLGVSSVTLNLKEPAGVALFKELVAESDVVLENFRPDVLPRLGLGYEALRAVREDIILARMPGLGTTGPRRLYGTWGPTLSAFSGLTYLWNHPDEPEPVGSQGVLPDYLAGLLAPLIVTAALLRRANGRARGQSTRPRPGRGRGLHPRHELSRRLRERCGSGACRQRRPLPGTARLLPVPR